jgi:GTP-binding protein
VQKSGLHPDDCCHPDDRACGFASHLQLAARNLKLVFVRYLWKFVTSASEVRQFPPPSVPETAFLGRSNVGKSSLINSLLGEKVAKTSSTPGRTRAINFFAVRRPGQAKPEVMFADLPGYGYAKLPRETVAEWPKFIEPYLRDRPSLALCVCLVDINIPPQERDKQLISFLAQVNRDVLIVATKADRLGGNQLRNQLELFRQEFQTENLLPYSSKSGSGKEELWKQIRAAAERNARQTTSD